MWARHWGREMVNLRLKGNQLYETRKRHFSRAAAQDGASWRVSGGGEPVCGAHRAVVQGEGMGVVQRPAMDPRLQLHAGERGEPRGPVAGAGVRGALRGSRARAGARRDHRLQRPAHPRGGAGVRRVARGARRLHGALRADALHHGEAQDARDRGAGQRLLAPEGDLDAAEAGRPAVRRGLPRRTPAHPARVVPRRSGLHRP